MYLSDFELLQMRLLLEGPKTVKWRLPAQHTAQWLPKNAPWNSNPQTDTIGWHKNSYRERT